MAVVTPVYNISRRLARSLLASEAKAFKHQTTVIDVTNDRPRLV